MLMRNIIDFARVGQLDYRRGISHTDWSNFPQFTPGIYWAARAGIDLPLRYTEPADPTITRAW